MRAWDHQRADRLQKQVVDDLFFFSNQHLSSHCLLKEQDTRLLLLSEDNPRMRVALGIESQYHAAAESIGQQQIGDRQRMAWSL